MSQWTLGIGGSDHDFAAALMSGTDIRVAIEQERLSRRKHGLSLWYESPVQQAINYCLSTEGLRVADIDTVVSSDTLPARLRWSLQSYRFREFGHHLCHAASAYMMCRRGTRAGVFVYDGYGSQRGAVVEKPQQIRRETFSFFVIDPHAYECIGCTTGPAYIEQDDFPMTVTNSLGMLYEMVTGLLGFDPMESGKTMGLAAYGVPRFVDVVEGFVEYGDSASDCFRCHTEDPQFAAAIEQILLSGSDGFSIKADVAASIQAVVNKTVLHCTQFFAGKNIEELCLSGGCALNTVANSFLVEHSQLGVPVTIPPHCGDAGLALGALWLHAFDQLGEAPELTFRGRSLNPHISRAGRIYSLDERHTAAHQFYPRIVLDHSVRSASDLAALLAQGAVLGIFNGASELGPRALGGRSIVANPASVAVRERINRVLKGREPFRPLAPLVLRRCYQEYFLDERHADPFMLKIAKVRERCMREAPAVVHADGTARVQVIPEDGDPFLIELLRAFHDKSGMGLLINTSLNRRGEPLVESPSDAIDAFLGMGLDGLYLDGDFYRSA
jgi:carbamoyltransferase